jgi:hypothetical protein
LKHSPKDLPQQISKWVADTAGASNDGYDSYTVPFGDHSSLDSIEMTDVGDGSRLCENSDAGLALGKSFLIALNKKRTALAVTVERRKERKQFCAFSARTRFHIA